MSWETQLGRLPDAEANDGVRCGVPDCKVQLAPYLARSEWCAMTEPPVESPRLRRMCCNHAAQFAANCHPPLPFPPGLWKDGKLGKHPIVFPIPEGTPAATCSSCRDTIRWIVTAAGKRMPVNLDGTSHFTTCEFADQHRKRK